MSAWTRGDTVARLKAQRQPAVGSDSAAAEAVAANEADTKKTTVITTKQQQQQKQQQKQQKTETTTVAAVKDETSAAPHTTPDDAAAAVQLGPLRLPHDIAQLITPGLYKFVGQLEAAVQPVVQEGEHKEHSDAAVHAEPAAQDATASAVHTVTSADAHRIENDNEAAAQVREAYAFPQAAPPMTAAEAHVEAVGGAAAAAAEVHAADHVEAAADHVTASAPSSSSVPRQRPFRKGGNGNGGRRGGYNNIHNNNNMGRQGRYHTLPIAPPATLPLELHPFGEIPRQYALRRQYAMHAAAAAPPPVSTNGAETSVPPDAGQLPQPPTMPLYYGPSASHFAGLNANAMPYHVSPIPYGPDPYSVDPYSHVMMGMPFHPTNRLQLRPPYVPRS